MKYLNWVGFPKALLMGAAIVFLLAGNVSAQMRVVRGEGGTTVSANAPTEADRNAALRAAKLAAWRLYLATSGQNEAIDQIRANESQFIDRLDDLLVDVITTDETFNRDSRRFTIRIKATVAESVLTSMLRGIARGAGVNQAGTGVTAVGAPVVGNAPIVVLALAREAESIRSFQNKVTNVSESARDAESSGTRSSAGGRNAAFNETSMSTVRNKEMTGGNSERKRDAVTYKIGNAGVLNSKLPRILLQNGIKASPYAFMMRPCNLPNPDNFSKQYAASATGELPSNVMADIQGGLATCGRAKYWVFASMDVGGYGVDPNTGMSVATVSVNVQIYEVDTGAPLASATKDVSGRSADQSDAIRVATDHAVQAVGDIITAQVASVTR